MTTMIRRRLNVPVATLFAIGLCVGAASLHAQSGWTRIQTSTTALLHGISFPSPMVGYAVGDSGTIIKSTDGGITWSSLASGVQGNLWTILFTSPTTGIVAGAGGVMLTTNNGGLTWTQRNSGLKDGTLGSFIFGLSTLDGKTWHAAGGDGQALSAVVLTSVDSGATWTKSDVAGAFFFDRCVFANDMYGYCVGLSPAAGGIIYATTDGGATWQPAHSSTALITSIQRTHAIAAIAVGSGGMLYRTDDGVTWRDTTTGSSADLLALVLRTSTEGVAVGDAGAILMTTDGGVSWRDQSQSGEGTLSDVTFAPGTGAYYVAGAGGAVFVRAGTNGVPADRASDAGLHFSLTPNPMRTTARLRTDCGAGDVDICNMLGHVVLHRHLDRDGTAVLERGTLASGMYLVIVHPATGAPRSGTLIVE